MRSDSHEKHVRDGALTLLAVLSWTAACEEAVFTVRVSCWRPFDLLFVKQPSVCCFCVPVRISNLHLQQSRLKTLGLVVADLAAQRKRGSGEKIRALGSGTGLEVAAVKTGACERSDPTTVFH